MQSTVQNAELSKILTPTLFESLRRVQMPWPEDQPLDFSAVAKLYFRGIPDNRLDYYNLVFNQALKPISLLGVDHVPDLMQFLPPPEATDFPSKALGLLTLLDQCPRSLFSGANERYTYDYFDTLAMKLVRQLRALPPSLRPDSMERLMAQGWSYDYCVVARFWFMTPFVHSEELEDHELQRVLAEGIRNDVEKHVGKVDANRGTVEVDSQDIYAFPRLVASAPIQEGMSIDDFFFWVTRVFTVHTPIIKQFGHYPYRNKSQGRISTPEEVEYIEAIKGFMELKDEEAAKKIHDDVAAGIWSPLQEESAFTDSSAGKIANHIWDAKE